MRTKINLIGLTGGIASGKSTFAGFFRKAGLSVVNLDEVGRQILLSDAATQSAVMAICGLSAPWNPALVREKIFQDFRMRQQVEDVLHPLIWKAFEKELEILAAKGERLVICEAALLIEAQLLPHFKELIVVHASAELRKKRLLARDAINADLAGKIFEQQTSDTIRKQHATHWIENDGDFEKLERQANQLIQQWRTKQFL